MKKFFVWCTFVLLASGIAVVYLSVSQASSVSTVAISSKNQEIFLPQTAESVVNLTVERIPIQPSNCAELRSRVVQLNNALAKAQEAQVAGATRIAELETELTRQGGLDQFLAALTDPFAASLFFDLKANGISEDDISIVTSLIRQLDSVPDFSQATAYIKAVRTEGEKLEAWNARYNALPQAMDSLEWPALLDEKQQIIAEYRAEIEKIFGLELAAKL